MPIWYIMDEFGSRIQHSDSDFNFRMVPFLFLNEGCAYSLLFPIKDCDANTQVTRDFLEGPEALEALNRKALLNIWKKVDLTEIDWKQEEPESDFFASGRTNESLPDADFKPLDLPRDKIKVYAEYIYIGPNLTTEKFEMVDDPQEADIVW